MRNGEEEAEPQPSFSSNFSINESYLQTGKRGTNMVRKEQRLKINEEIVREHLAAFSELRSGERSESHMPDNSGSSDR